MNLPCLPERIRSDTQSKIPISSQIIMSPIAFEKSVVLVCFCTSSQDMSGSSFSSGSHKTK